MPGFFESLRQLLMHASAETDNSLLHSGWEQREEGIYPALFGEQAEEPLLLQKEIFQQDFGRRDVHPFWLHHSVMTFAPTESRNSWLYVTSGMSNAFDSAADEWSGLGVEFILETHERAEWAKEKLSKLMAFNLLIAIGHYHDQSDIQAGSLVRLDTPVDGQESRLRNFIALQPAEHPADFSLVTGKAEFLQMVAITDTEADHADTQGAEALLDMLISTGTGMVINPDRPACL